jgi:ABC-2 type transport system ATP-binding protein
MSDERAIQIEGLSKAFRVARRRQAGPLAALSQLFWPNYERVLAVDGVSFAIEQGERVAFIGANGAGKSTTLKILAGILFPDAGRVEVLGLVPFRDRRRLAFKLGTVFGQRSQLWYELPARDTFELMGRVYEQPRALHQQRLQELIEVLQLSSFIDRPVRQLSLGERMRCELTASLLHRPSVLFLDEPTIGLDVAAKAAIRRVVTEQSRHDGSTLLVTSHDTGDIERVCERVIIMHRGRLLLDGPISALRKNHLRKKRVTLWSEKAKLELNGPGVTLIEQSPHRSILEIELERVTLGAVVDAALRQSMLHDMAIEDPPLEEVIRAVYERAEGKASP